MDPTHLLPNSNPVAPARPAIPSRELSQDSVAFHRYLAAASAPSIGHAAGSIGMDGNTTREPRKLVLCFDGTGNKFKGDDSDSNILKIFRCLDRNAGNQYHYYQPGIGTYVVSSSLSGTSIRERLVAWYLKAKDSAIGTSFADHVVGGYRFLMRFYGPGDEIYMFGFSRGAYVARFLAEMLDYIGLLSHGNEEMVLFAWKAFSQWQIRRDGQNKRDREKRHEMYRFLKGFRETFSRPVGRIRFIGLFDTVNSVPRFETAWMQRSRFPYTARTSARVIRHCVSIDERRAKFRQDLIYQAAERDRQRRRRHGADGHPTERYRPRRDRGGEHPAGGAGGGDHQPRGRRATLAPSDAVALVPGEEIFRSRSRSARSRSRADTDASTEGGGGPPAPSDTSRLIPDNDPDSDDEEQDMDEIWFAGGHGDVGGGWEFVAETKSASHVPLVYMIREAQTADLGFDPERLVQMGIAEELQHSFDQEAEAEADGEGEAPSQPPVDGIRIDVSAPTPLASQSTEAPWRPADQAQQQQQQQDQTDREGPAEEGHPEGAQPNKHPKRSRFQDIMHRAHVARIHDCLAFSGGLSVGKVLGWKMMEYLPFRRMDLQPDGSWRPIRWPLPCGETRDIPRTARIHGSVIRRMREDAGYRPGNLILAGGGRGVRRAPAEYGIGEWVCVQEYNDPIGEVWVRREG